MSGANTIRYMSEVQAFFLLSMLCDRYLPGYYSMTMYGTLLDQRVFESLVERTMPILWEHLVKSDVQLSVVSLPWFLSLYINSMPLIFAFRVLDVFFLEGPKVLFQVGLAILRINGEELLDVSDDGNFISLLKNYFSRLDESAHPDSKNEKYRNVTKFQELLVVAFKEFAGITQNTISEQRAKHKDAVLDNIESFAKRTSIRNLGPDSKRLSQNDLSFLYDRFYGILYEREQRSQLIQEVHNKRAKSGHKQAVDVIHGVASNSNIEVGRVGLGPSPTLMNYDGFREFLAGISHWAAGDALTSTPRDPILNKDVSTMSANSGRNLGTAPSAWAVGNSEPANHDFMRRLYCQWNTDDKDGLSLQNIVSGLAQVKGTRDIMTSISYFFELYDDDKDGKVDREGILRISEALLFLTRKGLEGGWMPSQALANLSQTQDDKSDPDERFLSSVSAFIRRCFEYADSDYPQNQSARVVSSADSMLVTSIESFSLSNEEEDLLELGITTPSSASSPPPNEASTVPQKPVSANLALDPANPLHITLPTFRMVVLADDLLQQFFESAFPSSFHLSPTPSAPSTPLTTFNSASHAQSPTSLTTVGGSHAGSVVPPAKGLRGVLDSIVSDGMRVASEVRKRVDEAQKELEKSAMTRVGTEDDDDDDDSGGRIGSGGAYFNDAERRSVREEDRDLLEDAEAVVGSNSGVGKRHPDDLSGTHETSDAMETIRGEKVIEFEQ